MNKIATALVAVCCLLACIRQAHPAVLYPFTAAVDPSDSSAWDIFNPNHPPGLVVEIFQSTFLSLIDQNQTSYPAHIVLNAPPGNAPAAQVTADVFYDGPAEAFPISAKLGVHLDFTTDGTTHGTSSLQGSTGLNSTTAKSFIQLVYPNSVSLTHNFVATIGPGQSNLTLRVATVLPILGGAGDHFYTIGNPSLVPVDPSQPIVRVTMTVVGVPEPSSLALAAFGLFSLALYGWRSRIGE